MTIAALLEDLQRRRIRLSTDGLNIRIHAPKGTLTPQVVDAIRDRKAELLSALEAKDQTLDEAKTLIDELLDVGCTFRVIRTDNADTLIWFGPATMVAAETRSRVLRLKPRLIALVRKMSRQTWEEPTLSDRREHRHWPADDDRP